MTQKWQTVTLRVDFGRVFPFYTSSIGGYLNFFFGRRRHVIYKISQKKNKRKVTENHKRIFQVAAIQVSKWDLLKKRSYGWLELRCDLKKNTIVIRSRTWGKLKMKNTPLFMCHFIWSLCAFVVWGEKKKSLRKPQRQMGQRIFRETAKQTYLCFEICLTN